MGQLPAVSATQFFNDQQGLADDAYLVSNTSTNNWLYSFSADSYTQIGGITAGIPSQSGGIYRSPWSKTMTTNGGSTTTLTVAAASFPIRSTSVGATLEFTSGANLGIRTTISSVVYSADMATVTLTFPAVANSVASGVTFRMNTGRYFIFLGGTVAAGFFVSFDVATASYNQSLSVTNLAASYTVTSQLTGAFLWGETYASGTATSATATTLVNSAKSWTTNQWTNFQVRITSGTGIGQIRVISSNTGTTLTVPTWTVTPDSTSTYVIEGDEDKLYLLGNNVTTMYRYSISADTWTVLSPTVGRGGAAGAGCSANFIGDTGDTTYSTESNNQNGRYIYSARAGTSAIIDRFDIAGGTSGAGAWSVATFTGDTSNWVSLNYWATQGRYIYGKNQPSGTGVGLRIIRFDTVTLTATPFASMSYYEASSGVSQYKCMMIKNLNSSKTVQWIYLVPNQSSVYTLFRLPVY